MLQLFVAYCVGNIIGPQLFLAQQAPSYNDGFEAMLVCFSIAVVFIMILRAYLISQNKKRGTSSISIGVEDLDPREAYEATLKLDKTDKQLPEFRYVY